MDTIGRPVAAPHRASKHIIGSVTVHLLVLTALIHHSKPWIAPIRLPGTEHGSNLILAYLPGRAPAQSTTATPKTTPQLAESKSPLPTPPKAKTKPTTASPNTNSPVSAQPDSTAGADALGSGNIDIALASFFPTPKPDLSSLPHGTKGDVILDIVIDATGKISDLKITSGLGHGIDETVIATVQQWTFHPATRNGEPVASEQELHFHYEKS
jgi:periplasmic protein TonB